ncbi:MAG: DUF1634 domain-containing protein [Candidatus Omnitrophica bacterium]|nr:DUF1634 domain-containing protein [Candidatus Omnitrophota bacterium]
MSKTGQGLPNHEMEIFIGNLLRTGVILAAATVFLGGMIYLVCHGFTTADYRVFQHEPSYLCSIRGIIGNAFSFHGRGLIQLGLLLLIATPITRVALSIYIFARKRDTLYVIITLIVFSILMYSLLGR